MNSPKVRIVMPVYNYAEYIPKAIESLNRQTYRDFEVFIVDDCSTDDSYSVAANVIDKYKNMHIVVLKNHQNSGLTITRLAGSNFSNSPYLLFLDPDDTIDPEYLAETVPVLDKNPEIGFVYVDTEYFGDSSQRFEQPEYNFYDLVMRGNFISYASLIRYDAFLESGKFNSNNWSYWEDYELWLRMGRKGWYGKHLPKKLFNYYVHSDSAIHSGFTAEAPHLFQAYFIKQYPEIYPPEYQQRADNILKEVPDNFMSLSKKENEVWWKSRLSAS